MKKNHAILLAASFLAACTTLGGPARAPACNTHVCHVEVVVDDACHVTVTPNDLPIAAENKNAVIQWQVSGGTFAADGIELKGGNGGSTEFDRWNSGPKVVTVVDHHTTLNRIYPYSVHVAIAHHDCPVLDPTIMN